MDPRSNPPPLCLHECTALKDRLGLGSADALKLAAEIASINDSLANDKFPFRELRSSETFTISGDLKGAIESIRKGGDPVVFELKVRYRLRCSWHSDDDAPCDRKPHRKGKCISGPLAPHAVQMDHCTSCWREQQALHAVRSRCCAAFQEEEEIIGDDFDVDHDANNATSSSSGSKRARVAKNEGTE